MAVADWRFSIHLYPCDDYERLQRREREYLGSRSGLEEKGDTLEAGLKRGCEVANVPAVSELVVSC